MELKERIQKSDTYKRVLKHRETCPKWKAKKQCVECFGGGLTMFGSDLLEEMRTDNLGSMKSEWLDKLFKFILKTSESNSYEAIAEVTRIFSTILLGIGFMFGGLRLISGQEIFSQIFLVLAIVGNIGMFASVLIIRKSLRILQKEEE